VDVADSEAVEVASVAVEVADSDRVEVASTDELEAACLFPAAALVAFAPPAELVWLDLVPDPALEPA